MIYILQLAGLVVFIGAASAALALYCRQLYLSCCDRNATPREPNPEPGPTMADGMEWGRNFEALGQRVTPHTLKMDGWREEQRAKETEIRMCQDCIDMVRHADERRSRPITLLESMRAEQVERVRELHELDQALAEDERANQ